MRRRSSIIALTVLFTFLIISFSLPSFGQISKPGSAPRIIELSAFQFGFEPNTIHINAGENIIFRITSADVVHGFYIDGYDFYVDIPPDEVVDVGPIIFDSPGKLKIRCSVTCGPLHPFMVADIVVEPNYFFPASILLTFGVFGGMILYVNRRPVNKMLGVPLDKDIDLLRVKRIGPLLKRAAQWRGIHFALIIPNLFIFAIVLAAGFFGNPTGNLNFSIAVVWILWFAAVEFMILFFGRLWCTLCPLPMFGEWFARRRFYGVHNLKKWASLGRTWPKSLDNMWVAALGFLAISLLVPWLVTRPVMTGFLFLILFAIPLITYTVFNPRRNFCRNICPASGYIGYHSNASLFAIRRREKAKCDQHIAKECISGSPKGYGCPWKLYPGGNGENTFCNYCLECLKSCSMDNMTFKLRMIGQDIANIAVKAKNKYDEAWMGFIRFTLAVFYELVFFGPFFWIKDFGNMGVPYGANIASVGLLTPSLLGLNNWFIWAVMVGGVSLVGYPAVFYGFAWLAKKAAGNVKQSSKQIFLSFSYALAPYGIFLWLAFAISLVTVNWAYPTTTFSDPMGAGWNLFGTRFSWRPILPEMLPYIQIPVLFIGLSLAVNSTYNIAMKLFEDHKKAIKSTIVMGILHVLAALVFVVIITG